MVTAPGYDPVIITSTETNSGYEVGDIFNPDVDINYDNKTESKTEHVFVNNSMNGDTKVVYTEVSNTISTVIVTVAIMLLLFLVVVAGFRYYNYQRQ